MRNIKLGSERARRRGRRFDRRFARHLLCALLIVNMLLNSIAVTAVSEYVPMNLGDVLETGDDAIQLGDSGVNDAETRNLYEYHLQDEKEILLSTIIDALKLPFTVKKVEMAAVLGLETLVMPQNVYEIPAQWLSVEPTKVMVHDKEKDDYLITVLADFVEAAFAVYTADDVYTIKLTHMVAAGVDGDAASQETEGESALEAHIEGDDLGALTGDVTDVTEADQSLFTYDLGGASEALLSQVLAALQLPLGMSEIEAAASLGSDDGGDEALSVLPEEGDYRVTALRDFDSAALALYTADGMTVVTFLNGRKAEEPVEPSAAPVEAPFELTEGEPAEAPIEAIGDEPVESPIEQQLENEPVEAPAEPVESEPVEAPVEILEGEPVEANAEPVEGEAVGTPIEFIEDEPVEAVQKPSPDGGPSDGESVQWTDSSEDGSTDPRDGGAAQSAVKDEVPQDDETVSAEPIEGEPAEGSTEPVDAPEGGAVSETKELEQELVEPAEGEPGDVSAEPIESVEGEPVESPIEQIEGEPLETSVESIEGEPVDAAQVLSPDGGPSDGESVQWTDSSEDGSTDPRDGGTAQSDVTDEVAEDTSIETDETNDEETSSVSADAEPASPEGKPFGDEAEPTETPLEQTEVEPVESPSESIEGEPTEVPLEQIEGEPTESPIEAVEGEPLESPIESVEGEPVEATQELSPDGDPSDRESVQWTDSSEDGSADPRDGGSAEALTDEVPENDETTAVETIEVEPAETPIEQTVGEPAEVSVEPVDASQELGTTEFPTDELPSPEASNVEENTDEFPTPISYPAKDFTGRVMGVAVNVSAPEGAFPEGTTMKVRAVRDADTLSGAADTAVAEDDFVEVKRLYAVDITFYDAQGIEIEPLLPISVVMSVAELAEDQEATVVHVDDEGNAEIVEQSDATAVTDDGKLALNIEMPASDEQTKVEYGTEPADDPSATGEEVVQSRAAEGEISLQDIVQGNEQTEVAFESDAFSIYVIVITEVTEPEPVHSVLRVQFALAGDESAPAQEYSIIVYNDSVAVADVLSALNINVGAVSVVQYDEAVIADGTAGTISGLQAGDHALSITLDGTIRSISVSVEDITGNTIVVKADDATTVYGQTVPADTDLTATVTGLPNGVSKDDIEYTLSRQDGTDAGTYTITPSGDAEQTVDNRTYNVLYVPGTLTIERAKVTVTADNKTKVYGAEDPEWTATVTGTIGEDTVAYSFSRAEGKNVGDYAITPSGDSVQGNYTVTYVPGTLSVTQRNVVVTITGKQLVVPFDNDEHEVVGFRVTWEVTPEEGENQQTVNGYYSDADFECDIPEASAKQTEVGKTYMRLMWQTVNFSNINPNFQAQIEVVDGYVQVTPADEVIVTITGQQETADYDGTVHSAVGYEVEINNRAYTEEDFVFSGTASVDRTDAGTTYMGLNKDQFTNINTANFSKVTFIVVEDGFVTIDPIETTVTITGEIEQTVYDGEKHTASGYQAEAASDLYDVTKDFTFNGTASAERTNAGRTGMGLTAAQFNSTNANFSKVTFTVVDGYVDIEKAQATVTITGKSGEEDYNGKSHSATDYDVSIDNTLYTEQDFALRQGKTAHVERTDVGTTYMGLESDWFINNNDNFEVEFEIAEDGFITIDPIETKVTIQGKHKTEVFAKDANGEPITYAVTGFTAQAESPLYNVSYVNEEDCDYDFTDDLYNCDFKFTGNATASGNQADTYEMHLSETQFVNKNPNFSYVEFEVAEDGWLTIDPIVIVTKTLDDTKSDEQTFEFTALLKDDQGKPVKGYHLHEEDPAVTTGENGEAASFSLEAKHGAETPASITLRVPKGDELTVTEVRDERNYLISTEMDEYGREETNTAVVTVDKNETVIAFVNARTKYCRISGVEGIEFQTIQDAVEYAANPDNKLSDDVVIIEMLRDYTMPVEDVVSIPEGLDIMLTTASDYVPSGDSDTATITRSSALLTRAEPMFVNAGTLRIGDGREYGGITLIGGEGSSNTSMIANSGTLYVNEYATLQGAKRTGNGGAISNTGVVYIDGGALSENSATANGGAIYNQGSAYIQSGALSGNQAANGGAVYNATGGSLYIQGGELTGNSATTYGGAVYSAGSSLSVSDGVIGGETDSIENINADLANTAQKGAAIYIKSGINNAFSGGMITGNLVTSSDNGAVDIESDAVKLSFSGSAYIYLNALKTEDEAELGNEEGQGGGEGQGGEEGQDEEEEAPKLDRNVCLSVDSDLVINALPLNDDAKIGVYIPGDKDIEGSLYQKRGMSGDVFGSYSSTANAQAFINDRLPSMMRSAKNYKLVWGQPIMVVVRYKNIFNGASDLPPQTTNCSINKTYNTTRSNPFYPAASENYIADIAADVRSMYQSDHKMSETAAFACAYAVPKKKAGEKQATVEAQSFNQYVTSLVWDSTNGTWNAVRKDSDDVVENIERLVIYYSEPAYFTISNNADFSETDQTGSTLKITGLTVNGIAAMNEDYLGYGLVVAKNGATQQHFPALTDEITEGAITMGPATSYKLMFPGAGGKSFTFAGSFDNSHSAEVGYTYKDNGHPDDDTPGTGTTEDRACTISGTTFSDKTTSVNIQFGDAIPICRIKGSNGDLHEYTTLTEAFNDAVDHWEADDSDSYTIVEDGEKIVKIEMLRDYLVPDTDKAEITDDTETGVHIVLTTAPSEDYAIDSSETTRVEKYIEGATPTTPKEYYTYKHCAKLSRDQGNGNSFFIVRGQITNSDRDKLKTVLRIEDMRFEGKGVSSSNGGVLWASDCDVTLKNIKCTDFTADDGGAFYVGAGVPDKTDDSKDCSKLNVIGSYFANCTSTGGNGHGGGAIRTAALTLTMNDCVFKSCKANGSNSQGGGVFQWIRKGNANRKYSSATVSDCLFDACETDGTGGGMELNSFNVELNRCTFNECISKQKNGNKGGGGFNIWLEFNDNKIVSDDCKLELNECVFKNCHVNQHGGAFRIKTNNTGSNSLVYNVTLKNTIFTGNSAEKYGGAIWLTESKAKLTIDGCTFRGNTAVEHGGAIKSDHPLEIKNSTFTSNTVSKDGFSGGGIYCNKATTIDGCTFEGNEATTYGGGVYCDDPNSNTKPSLTICGNTSITGNALTTSTDPAYGAGVYYTGNLTLGKANAGSEYDVITIKDNTVSGNQASNLWLGNLPSVVNHLSGEIRISNGADKVFAGNMLATTTNKTFDGLSDGDHVFYADIDDQLWGVMKRSSNFDVIWRTSPICKITGDDGHILYLDSACKEPAIFDALGDDSSKDGVNSNALGMLRYTDPELYDSHGNRYSKDRTYYIKMLVPEYKFDVGASASIKGNHTIVLTTASSKAALEDGYAYPENAEENAVIYRGEHTGSMFCTRDSTHFILENITIDGCSTESTDMGGFVNLKSNSGTPTVELRSGSVVRNFYTKHSGGAFYFMNDGTLIINGGQITNCHAKGEPKDTVKELGGGAICLYSDDAMVRFLSGTIESCSSDTMGGAISQAKGTLEISGGTIEDCSAGTYGGGVYVFNGKTLNMTPDYDDASEENASAVITGCSAALGGGGIAVEGAGARLIFSGNAVVNGNNVGGVKNNVELNVESDEVIQVARDGLGEDALIGVYVTGEENEKPYDGYGKRNQNFGRYQFDTPSESDARVLRTLHLFINDRNDLMGAGKEENSKKSVYWEVFQNLQISKEVVSDAKSDANERFYFVVTVLDREREQVDINGTFGYGKSKLTFKNGVAKIGFREGTGFVAADGLKTGEYKLAVGLPVAQGDVNENAYMYTVQECGGFDANGEALPLSSDYLTYTSVNGSDPELQEQAEASGYFVENNNGETFLIHRIAFTNERKKANLTISKTVESNVQADQNHTFSYTVELTGVVSGRTYTAKYRDANSGLIKEGNLTFANGRASFDLEPGVASVTIEGLPSASDVTFKVTQSAAKEVKAGFNSAYNVTIGQTQESGTGWVVSDKKLVVGDDNVVAFVNTPKTGILTIKKVVSSDLESDKTKKFSFTVTLTGKDARGSYAIKKGIQTVGQAVFTYDSSTGKNVATGIEVDSQNAVTIVGLPTDLRYSVVEGEDASFTTRAFRDSGTVTTNESVATFTNTRNKGSLTIQKLVESPLKDDVARTYTFLIGLGNLGKDGHYEFEKTVSMSAKTSPKTVSGLPVGVPYHVVETTKVEGLTGVCTSGNSEGDDIAMLQGPVVFTNTRALGDLKISNTVVSSLIEGEKLFTFKLTMAITDGKQFNYKVYQKNESGAPQHLENKDGTLTFTSGSASLTLAGGQYAVIESLPKGATFTVKQTADSGYKTTQTDTGTETYTITGNVGPTEAAATPENPMSEAGFTNTLKTGNLRISKTVSSALASDRDRSFTFTLSMSVGNSEYKYDLYNGNTLIQQDISLKFIDGTSTFTDGTPGGIVLKHGQSALVKGLPNSGVCTVTETAESYTVDGTSQALYTTTVGSSVTNIASATIKSSLEQKAVFANKRKTGTLTVSNTVSSPLTTDETSAKYYFKVKITEGTTPVSGTFSNLSFDEKGEAVFYLTGANSSKSITLPVGLQYSVSAVKDANKTPLDESYNYNVTAANDQASGTVTDQNGVAFTTARKSGDLKISKTVVSDMTSDANRPFSFTLNLTSLKDGQYTYDLYTDDSDTPIESKKPLVFKSGVSGTILLKHGQSAIIRALPRGATFTVKETAEDDFQTVKDKSATVSLTQQEAEQAGKALSEAAVTNTRKTGKLTIKKNVISTVRFDMKDQLYTFYIQLGRYDEQDGQNVFVPDAAFNGKSYSYNTKDPTALVEFAHDDVYGDAVGTLTINGIASRTVEGLPEGIVCKVWEQVLPAFDVEPIAPVFQTVSSAAPVTASFTNTRKAGGLTITKEVRSDWQDDQNATYRFKVILNDESVGDTTVYPDGVTFGNLTFKNGESEFDLSVGDSVYASGLPTGIGYTVKEISCSSGEDLATHFITTMKLNGSDVDPATGTISETESAVVVFTNARPACKITADNALLYYRKTAEGEDYLPAAYLKLEDAFEALDAGVFYTKGTDGYDEYTDASLDVEMLVSEYTLTQPLTINSAKSVTLTTGSSSAREFPYIGTGYATVKRGFDNNSLSDSMLTVNNASGSLTLSHITLDGNGGSYAPACDGGIVYVASGALVVNPGATLQNSNITGMGGAVYVASGASMTMTGGEITGNSAVKGGAVDVGVDDQGMTAATLNFSGAPTIYDNLASDDTQRNIVLSADSATVINVIDGGLTGGKLGVYVVEDYLPSRGMRERPFATFVQGANGNPDVFKSDRNADMVGVATTDGSNAFVWSGMLQLQVCEFGDSSQLIKNARLTLTNEHGMVVWSGDTDRNGLVRIPWKGDAEEDGIGGANFSIGSTYTLRQAATDSYHTCPNGYWTLSVVDANGDEDGEEYAITFTANSDPTTPEIELVSDVDAPGLLYNLYNIKVKSYSIDKIWLDENGNEISQGDDRLRDLNVTFKLYRVSASSGVNYGANNTDPPAVTKMSDADIATIFPKWLEVMDPNLIEVPENQDSTNYRNNYQIVLSHGPNVQVGFMPLTINGITKWYIVPSEKSANLGTFLSDGNTDGVSDLANNADFVAFSGRILKSGVDFESINNNSQIQITNTTDFGSKFKRGDILEYNDKLWVYRNDGDNTPNTPPSGNLYYLLGAISSSSGSGSGQGVTVEYGSQSNATSLEQELTTVQHYIVEAVNQAERIDASSHTTPTETSPYVIDADDSWRYAFVNLEGGYVYYAVETAVLDDAVTDPNSAAAQAYNPTYVYDQNKDTIKVKNTTPDYVARVSNDGGNNWSYHIKLVNDSDSDTGIKQGAFNRANSLSGDVIIETLKESHDRYTLTSGFNFNNADLTSLTIRTTPDTRFNVAKQGKRTTLVSSGNSDDALIKTSCDTAVSNLIFNGGSNGGANNTRRALYVTTKGTSADAKGQVTIRNCAFSNFKVNDKGGAIYVTNDPGNNEYVDCVIIGSTFENCRGTDGGAVFMNKGSVKLSATGSKQTSFVNCYATNGNGGAIRANDSVSTANNTGTIRFENCSAKNGGAIYAGSGDNGEVSLEGAGSFARVTFKNCRATNGDGGAIYQQNGSVTLKHVVFGEISNGEIVQANACSASSSGGALYHKKAGTIVIEDTAFYGCTAGTRDGSGNVTANGSGGAIRASAHIALDNLTIKGCSATQHGGGIYMNWGVVNHGSTKGTMTIEDCTAEQQGGGVWINNKGNYGGIHFVAGCTISDCTANETGNAGGGIYSLGDVNMEGGSVTGCHAPYGNGGGVCQGETTREISISGASVTGCDAVNGGGVYVAKGTLRFSGTVAQTTGATPVGNSAQLGGGIYVAGNATMNMTGGSVTGNSAQLGGGIYAAEGASLSMTNGSVADNTASGNSTATVGGGGFYVADGASLNMSGGNVTGNTGAGIVPGGTGSRLTFSQTAQVGGTVKVGGVDTPADNTMTQDGSAVKCNMYLDLDSNEVIQSTGFSNANAYVGVYVTDRVVNGKTLLAQHGKSRRQFGTIPSGKNGVNHLDRFQNDRDIMLFGVKHGTPASDMGIYWNDFICKITDKAGKLLYKQLESGEYVPALYDRLYNSTDNLSDIVDDDVSAFGMLANADKNLYSKSGDSYSAFTQSEYCVKMLVPEYTMEKPVKVPAGKTVTFTTATKNEQAEDGYPLDTEDDWQPAVVTRGFAVGSQDRSMFATYGSLILKDITLDGGAKFNEDGTVSTSQGIRAATDGVIVCVRESGSLTIQAGSLTGESDGTTLRNAYTTNGWGGGAVATSYDNGTPQIIMEGGLIENCGAANNGGGILNNQHGSITITGGRISNCHAGTSGGGIYMWPVSDKTLTMTGGTIENCHAGTSGGAVFVGSGVIMTLSGGTIDGNTVAEDGKGAGIYLSASEDDQYHGRLKLSGNPSFGGTGRGDDDAIIAEVTENGVTRPVGNFVDADLTGKTNGQKTYNKVRQDIYMEGYANVTSGDTTTETPATSIVVTGVLDVANGSIWVWPSDPAHYKMLTQFATFADSLISNNKVVFPNVDSSKQSEALEKTYLAFRNARDDGETECGGDYLTGQEGDAPNLIKWTGGFDIVFRKIDGNGNAFRNKDDDGNALDVPKFTLYLSVKDSGKLVPTKKDTKDTAVDADDLNATVLDTRNWEPYKQLDGNGIKTAAVGESKTIAKDKPVTVKAYLNASQKPVDRKIYGDGMVAFEKIPPGNYFMVETIKPTGWQSMYDVYRVYVDGSGWISISPVERDSTGKLVWPDNEKETVPATNYTTKFMKDATEDVYTWAATVPDGAATVDIYNIMNVSTLTRKVVLRKVEAAKDAEGNDNDTLYDGIAGAEFTVYCADKRTPVSLVHTSTVKDDDGKEQTVNTVETLTNLTSKDSGAFWMGQMPLGTYYIEEKVVADDFVKPEHYFKLEVTDDATMLHEIVESKADSDKLPGAD